MEKTSKSARLAPNKVLHAYWEGSETDGDAQRGGGSILEMTKGFLKKQEFHRSAVRREGQPEESLKEKRWSTVRAQKQKELKKGSAKDLSHTWKREDYRRPKTSLGFKPPGWALGFWGVRVLLLVVVSPFLLGCGNGESKEELSSIKTRLDQVDERLTRLGEVDERLIQLEGTKKKMAHLESQVKKLERCISKLNRPVASRTKKRRYHEVRQGDSLFKIAQKHGITVEELCRLNKITPKTVIRPGQKILVAR